MKKIMRGVLHYETGSYDVVPSELEGLLDYSGIYADLVELPGCKKLTQIKLFKKGRVDLKFSSPECAEEFVDRYLGRVA